MSEKPFCYQLFEEMRTTEKIIKDIISSICAKHELSSFAAFVIGDLKRESGQTSKALASRCCVKPSNFTPFCRFLEEKGYIERKQDEKDRRAFRLYLTEEGKELACTIDKDFIAAFGANTQNGEELQQQVLDGFAAVRALVEPFTPSPSVRKEN